ncbi:hypothetical protein SAY86_003977 [Trapa natans]|uniref:Uncharacterized protein n=1 Tax=Trapa natans TaxID=22666 RepID=A0AAN7MY01_TRANT|nr:hypothetical protein SAY86_003977 [Trapa natans]
MNVPPPPPLPAVNSWIWRVDPTIRRSLVTEDRRQACSTPLCVAFVIVVGGLLLDVLLSMTFGVSAVPINVIIGVVIILGLGTSLRLMLDCYHEWSSRRPVPRLDTNVNITYLPPLLRYPECSQRWWIIVERDTPGGGAIEEKSGKDDTGGNSGGDDGEVHGGACEGAGECLPGRPLPEAGAVPNTQQTPLYYYAASTTLSHPFTLTPP